MPMVGWGKYPTFLPTTATAGAGKKLWKRMEENGVGELCQAKPFDFVKVMNSLTCSNLEPTENACFRNKNIKNNRGLAGTTGNAGNVCNVGNVGIVLQNN